MIDKRKLSELMKNGWSYCSCSSGSGGSGGSASKYKQPDWGAETAIVDLLPNTELTVTEEVGVALVMQEVTLIEGNVYTVNFNGTEYNCTAVCQEGMIGVALGNVGAMMEGMPVVDAPFVFMAIPEENREEFAGACAVATALDGSTSFTLSIKGEAEVVHAIPPTYLGNVMRVTVANDKTADKTYEEIEAAIENGVIVQVFFDAFNNLPENGYTVYTLSQFVKGAGILFYNGSFKQLLTVKSDGTINVSLAD